jgi:tetratricopeptide (TPR) repeat protein
MTMDDGIGLLLRNYDNHEIQPHVHAASKIISRLGGLALAIDQAAAYIQYKQMPLNRLSDFLITFEKQRKKILQYTPKNFWEYGTIQIYGEAEQNRSINAFTTWEMSFQQLESDNEQRKGDIAHFLTLSAFLDPTEIGEALFYHYWRCQATLPNWMQIFCIKSDESEEEYGEESNEERPLNDESRLSWNSEQFWAVIAMLYKLSLLQSISESDSESASFSLHPLIRDWLQLREQAGRRQEYTQEGINVVLSCIKKYESSSTSPNQRQLLMTHMDACLSNDLRYSRPQYTLGSDATSCDIASWFARFYRNQGRYYASEMLEQLVVGTRTRTIGPKNPSTLRSMGNLASTYQNQGRWKEAEKLEEQVMETSVRVLGQEHPDTLTSMGNLASIYQKQGRWKEAEKLQEQVMETSVRVLGQEHPDTLTSMGNLASIYLKQGRWKEAEKLQKQVMETSVRVLGQEHPDTLMSMGNLASIYRNQERWKEAEKLEEQVMEMSVRVLGQEHPDTLTSMGNLASIYWNQGRWKEAEKLEEQVMKTSVRVLGQEHPDTLTSIGNLVSTYRNHGRWKEAEKLQEQLMAQTR